MKFLITGFKPFHTNDINPSSLVLDYLKDKDIITCQLSVSYLNDKIKLENLIKEVRPDYVISLGLAASRNKITPELCAINYMYSSIPDNDNVLKQGEKIDENGPNAYFTDIPVLKLIEMLKENGFNSDLSTSAGSYVCNSTYYHLLSLQTKYHFKGLFIHVPKLDVVSIENLDKALKLTINFLKNLK